MARGRSRKQAPSAAVAPAAEDNSLQEAEPETEPGPDVLVGDLVPADDVPEIADVDDPLAEIATPTAPAAVGERPAPLAPLRDPAARFLAEARRYPRLSEAEERSLIEAVRGTGDVTAARNLVVHNLRLVISIAYQYRRAWTNMLDLFQEGSIGLMEAVQRWDPNLGTRFGTYASYWIRAYILRFLMRNARLIHVGNTRAGRKLFFRLEKERARLRSAGFDVTPKLLAANLDVAEKDIEEVSRALDAREVSLSPGPEGEGLSLGERLAGPRQESPEDQTARSQLSASVREVMDRFAADLADERERAVWTQHLAPAGESVSLSDLGRQFGVSKQRMGQITDRLKQRFREQVVAALGDDIQMAWQPEGNE